MKLLKLRFFYFICLLSALNTWAQDIVVKGQITDENGLPVPGATILVKGTQNGSSSDIDGNYQVQAGPAATLVISYVGYSTQEIPVQNRTSINASLVPSVQTLEEVVVVGYGTQKKSVVTGAISSVKAAQIENLPVTRIEQSLQGRVSGVTIFANAGQPGSGSTVRVRGITSFNDNNDPLWVVDGVIVDNGGIGVINQSDIESIEVLKDAASTAIYGTRAATGVILVTTKKGKAGKLTVNYTGYAGSSQAARKLDLLDARQYATLRNEQYANGYTGGTFALPYPNAQALGKGTNWQDQIFNNNAQRSNHQLSLSGGNDKSTFYLSFGLNDQEGIVTSQISSYLRKNIRLNSTHKVTKWLNFGQTASYSREKTVGLGNTNGEYGGPLASAINLDPTTPAVITDLSTVADPTVYTGHQYAIKDKNGHYYGISDAVQQEMTNPLAYVQTRLGNYDWADNLIGNAYLEVLPIEGLKLRSTVSGKLAYYGNESFTPMSYLGPNSSVTRNNLSRTSNKNFGWSIENTASYTKTIASHSFTILAGQGAYVDNIQSGQGITYYEQPVNNHNDASFSWSTPAANITGYGFTNPKHIITSLFGRLNYDYKEKYLVTGIIRRDGSSRFGSNNKYGTFPSFSLGWVITKEDFWTENKAINSFKLKGGYGVVGNDAIGDFSYLSLIAGGNNYTVGNSGAVTVGNSPVRPSNPDLKWEQTSQTNIGFDATLLKDFTLTAEWYQKKTTGILQDIILTGYVGATGNPRGNVGEMKNQGVEFELGYHKKVGELNIGVNGNISTLKNTVTNVGQDRKANIGPGIQSSNGELTRSEVGSSFNEFYGYQTNGIFQNQADIDNYKNSAGQVIQPDAKPGDFRWKDLNDDGKITVDDRKFLGSPLPNLTYGLTINLEYKGFDFMAMGQGVSGNKIYQGLRRLDMVNANWQTEALNRWTGEGTSNTFPRLTTTDTNHNFSNPSNFHLQDGDYFRIKVIQLGYSLPQDLISKAGLAKTRIYVTAENLFTFTKYTGFDPEIGGNVMGIDRGYYPQARSLMVGCNLQF